MEFYKVDSLDICFYCYSLYMFKWKNIKYMAGIWDVWHFLHFLNHKTVKRFKGIKWYIQKVTHSSRCKRRQNRHVYKKSLWELYFIFIRSAIFNLEKKKTYSLKLLNSVNTHLTGWYGGHRMFISWQCEGSVDNPPVPLQWNIPTVPTLVELLNGGDELVPIDSTNDGWEAIH